MKNKIFLMVIAFSLLSIKCFSQETVKIVTYNILNYPNLASEKNAKYQQIFNEIKPDIVVVQEILSQNAVNQFRDETLGSEFSAAEFINGPDTDNALFYKDSLFEVYSVDFLPTIPRYITEFRLFHKLTLDTLIIYSAHFKAGDTPSDENTRLNEAAVLRIFTDMLPAGSNFMLVGDLNLYRSTEPAFEWLINPTGSGYLSDPINRLGSWHNNSGYSDIHTQSTRTAQLPDGGSNGGLDDRFDFILISEALNDSDDVHYIDGSYWAYGNDGMHFNNQIIDPPYPINQNIAFALHDVSDHLPVVAEFNFGKISSVENSELSLTDFQLYQNYPNPFNPSTTISFQMPNSEYAKVVIYDLLGNEITILFEGFAPQGKNSISFDGSSASGRLTSGMYFYSLITATTTLTKKMVLLK